MDPRIMETEEPSFILAKTPLLLLKRAANGGRAEGEGTGVGAKFAGSTALTAPRRTEIWDILGSLLDSGLWSEVGDSDEAGKGNIKKRDSSGFPSWGSGIGEMLVLLGHVPQVHVEIWLCERVPILH